MAHHKIVPSPEPARAEKKLTTPYMTAFNGAEGIDVLRSALRPRFRFLDLDCDALGCRQVVLYHL